MCDDVFSKIAEIFFNENINEVGYCSFDEVKDELIACRAKRNLPNSINTVICALFPYKTDIQKRNISYYAVSRDYHLIVKTKLDNICRVLKRVFSDNFFLPFVDSSPINEVTAGIKSNLGVRGDNTLLINDTYGSYVFISEILTDLYIPYNKDNPNSTYCMHCGSCQKACPSGALKNGRLDTSLCLSAISQKKGKLSEKEISLLRKSDLVWGCDICQEVCPLNKEKKNTNLIEFESDIVPIIHIGDYDKLQNRAFQWRKSDVIERNISLLKEE